MRLERKPVLYICRAIVVVAPAGPPDVMARGISKVLNPAVINKIVFMTMVGTKSGSLILRIIWNLEAPSMAAASISSGEIFCRDAI